MKSTERGILSNQNPEGIVMAESMIPKDEDWTEYRANEFLFPFCAFWTSYLYVELFLLLCSSIRWVFQQYFTLLECTIVLYHIQTLTLYQDNHNGNVMWPIIQ